MKDKTFWIILYTVISVVFLTFIAVHFINPNNRQSCEYYFLQEINKTIDVDKVINKDFEQLNYISPYEEDFMITIFLLEDDIITEKKYYCKITIYKTKNFGDGFYNFYSNYFDHLRKEQIKNIEITELKNEQENI